MARFFAERADSSAAGTFYGLINGQNGDSHYHIGAFTRAAGVYSEYGSNPVLSATGSGWESAHVKDPWLMYVGGQYVMYYSGYDGSHYRIGRATATAHTGPWTRDLSNPLIGLGAAASWRDDRVTFPTVLYEPSDTGREWKMWCIGNNESLGYFYSSDGLSWTEFGSNPVVVAGAPGTWSDEGVGLGTVLNVAGTYNMFISGRKGTTNPQWQSGLYTFTDPEGTYTANGGNPLIKARHNDSGTSVVPSADVLNGATTVSMADTSPFNVGEPIAIADGDTTAHIGYIASIDSGTQVTLDRAVTGNFTGAGKVFRSFALNSIVPRTIVARSGGGYEAFCTPFQPVDDLTQPASKLWEGAFEMRASDLTGPWTYNYVAGRGLLFPLTIGAAWHTRSAENPSVIAAP